MMYVQPFMVMVLHHWFDGYVTQSNEFFSQLPYDILAIGK